ncbi:MAG: hypothetical protein ACE5HX_13640, partial [bacterium]
WVSNSEKAIAQQKSKWRIKNRLQASYEYDDNIREDPGDTLNLINDSSLRFLFHSRTSRISPDTRLILTYRGGLQTYFQNANENKLINEFEFISGLKIQKFVLGIRAFGRLKIYLNDILDYDSGSAEVYLQLPPFLNFRNEISVQTSGLNYQNFSTFNYSENQVSWSISKKIASRLSGMFALSGKQVNYDRSVINSTLEQPTNFFEVKLRDHNFKAQFQLNYTQSFLINFNYTFQRNNSNSRVYEYDKHQLTLIFGFPLMRGLWLRGYGAVQFKNYVEETIPIFLLDIDTEREESNFLILDLSKDLSPNLTALLRFAHYDNESIIRSRFYRKNLITLGFDFRF